MTDELIIGILLMVFVGLDFCIRHWRGDKDNDGD